MIKKKEQLCVKLLHCIICMSSKGDFVTVYYYAQTVLGITITQKQKYTKLF